MLLLVVSKWRRIAAKTTLQYNLFLLWGICHLVVHRKIIRKVNDNDDGREVDCAVFGVRGSSGGNNGAR